MSRGTLTEQHLYGAGRIGMRRRNLALNGGGAEEPATPATRYELTNHLGNVMAVISDAPSDGALPTVESLTDYYPFGMAMPGRSYNAYRYGFNGKEFVFDQTQDYGERIYSPNLARFLSADPLIVYGQEYPELSPYQFASNTPIWAIDLDGLEKLAVTGCSNLKGNHYRESDGSLTKYTKTIRKQADRLNQLYGYRTAIVCTGKQIVQELIKETSNSKDGQIHSWTIFSHGEHSKLCLQDDAGLYPNIESIQLLQTYINDWFGEPAEKFKEEVYPYIGADYLGAISQAISEGEIKFSNDAVIFIDACNTGDMETNPYPIAQELADITGASVIAPSGFAYMQDMNPPIANGKFTTDENKAFYMFQKGKSPQNLGKDINMDEYIKK